MAASGGDGRGLGGSWRPGDRIVYRELWRGHVVSALPMTVVQTSPERVVLYRSAGARWHATRIRGREGWSHETLLDTLEAPPEQRHMVSLRASPQHSLFIYEPAAAHSLRIAWTADWSFTEWYVNFEEPWRQTPSGVDSMDHFLDLVGTEDLRWRVKDEAELRAALRRGLLDQPAVDRILRRAERLMARIDERGLEASGGWARWRPPEDWPVDRESAAG
jgi:hypothetical protein